MAPVRRLEPRVRAKALESSKKGFTRVRRPHRPVTFYLHDR
jgi:hypothetical protein